MLPGASTHPAAPGGDAGIAGDGAGLPSWERCLIPAQGQTVRALCTALLLQAGFAVPCHPMLRRRRYGVVLVVVEPLRLYRPSGV